MQGTVSDCITRLMTIPSCKSYSLMRLSNMGYNIFIEKRGYIQ